MLIVVVTLFAVCWLPLHVFIVVLDFVPQLRSEDQPEASSIVIAVYTTVHWLAMSNSFVNPIVYGFMNDSFRVRIIVQHQHTTHIGYIAPISFHCQEDHCQQ